jgi:hypothetical protein
MSPFRPNEELNQDRIPSAVTTSTSQEQTKKSLAAILGRLKRRRYMINAEKISDWLQVIGMFGVVASLVFVGLQMKQTHEIALSSIYQSRSDTTVEQSMATTGSPELLNALSKVYSGRDHELTMPESVAFEHYLGATMTMFENNHHQFEMGFLGEAHWQRNLRELKYTLDSPFRRQIIAGWQFRESFMNLIEQISEQATDSDGDCWIGYWNIPAQT